MTRNLHCNCGARPPLERHSLAAGLPAQHCPACGSVLLALADYRPWRARQPAGGNLAAPAENLPAAPEASQARPCPACQRLMSRHRTGTTPDFRLDRCSPCQLVWLDAGEWELLESHGLTLQLDAVLTEAWQQRVQAAEAEARRDQALRTRLGEDTFAEVRRLQAWLAEHPQRTEILAELNAARRRAG